MIRTVQLVRLAGGVLAVLVLVAVILVRRGFVPELVALLEVVVVQSLPLPGLNGLVLAGLRGRLLAGVLVDLGLLELQGLAVALDLVISQWVLQALPQAFLVVA